MTTISLPTPPSLNNMFFNVPGKGRVKTKEYTNWSAAAGWTLITQKPPKIAGPVALSYAFADEGRADLGNLEKAVSDLLVTYQVIEDDSRKIVRSIHLEWAASVESGCRITITKAGEGT